MEALGTLTMTILSDPLHSIARAWVREALKGPEQAQNDQKLGKYVPKLELLVGYFQDFLGTGSRDIHDENLIRPPA